MTFTEDLLAILVITIFVIAFFATRRHWQPLLSRCGRHFTKKRLIFFVVAVFLYVGLWLLTDFAGAPKTRAVALRAMRDIPASGIDISSADSSRRYSLQNKGQKKDSWHTFGNAPPWYYCRASAYAPFLIRIDYGWATGPLRGDGGSVWYFWMFGGVFRVYEFDHWSA